MHGVLPFEESLRYSTLLTSPGEHPALLDLGRVMQQRLDRILEAEQEAASVMARRMAVLRDRLLEAEDAGDTVAIVTIFGTRVSGVMGTVASDHVELRDGPTAMLVAIDQIAVVELR
jgi:hypothetical protein